MRCVDIDDDVLEVQWGCSVADKLDQVGGHTFMQQEAEAVLGVPGLVPAVTAQATPEEEAAWEPAVVSLSGSNALDAATIAALRQRGLVVLLDAPHSDIVKRAEAMKTDRIVTPPGMTLRDVLAKRAPMYEACYDTRVFMSPGQSIEAAAAQVVRAVSASQQFVSTRDAIATHDGNPTGATAPAAQAAQATHTTTFLDVVRRGLAPDRGLYVPAAVPDPLDAGQLERLLPLQFAERTLRIMERFPLGDGADLTRYDLARMLQFAYESFEDPRVLPVSRLDGHAGTGGSSGVQFLAEEYWGPTASFKDLSLQLTPQLLAAAEARASHSTGSSAHGGGDAGGARTGLLVATSGDTGCAALHGFLRSDPTRPVVVLYPHNGVSPVQERQMVTAPSTACVMSVDGDFDYCQSVVKNILGDEALQRDFAESYGVSFGSANSINWGRLLPQVAYCSNAYLTLAADPNVPEVTIDGDAGGMTELDVCIPTGNFGNILGAVYAKRLGFPLRRLVCASNVNNVLHDFIETGVYDLRNRNLLTTASPSIDILVSSNLERFLHLLSAGDATTVGAMFRQLDSERHFSVPPSWVDAMHELGLRAHWCDEDDSLAAIGELHTRTGVLIDPHTAVAKVAADADGWRDDAERATGHATRPPMLVCSTAHVAKFPPAILGALGISPAEDPDRDAQLQAQWEQLAPLMDGAAVGSSEMHVTPTSNRRHRSLDSAVSAPRVHDTRVPATQTAIVEQIRAYLDRTQAG